MRRPAHDILFQPIEVGQRTFRNRFFQTPFNSGFGLFREATEADFRGTRADGGWAAVSTGTVSPSPDSDTSPRMSERLWGLEGEDERHRAFTDRAHAAGAMAVAELGHRGALSTNYETRWPGLSASAIPVAHEGAITGVPDIVPKAMEIRDIERVQQSFVDAALRAERVGFDVVYVYAANNHLPAQFLSTTYNRRRDQYGGSFENRARFLRETVEKVRAVLAPSTVLGVRIAADEDTFGITRAETFDIVQSLDSLVDLWDFNMRAWSNESPSSRFSGVEALFPNFLALRGATAKPVVAISRFIDPDVMAAAIGNGVCDFIGGARPAIADPYLPKKIEAGEYDEIRECTGSNICINRSYLGTLTCVQNATAGEEHRHGWSPESFAPIGRSGDVLIVGAGPAGMECAVVLARRGVKNVHVVDAERELGGNLRYLAGLPGLGEWRRIINYRQIQMDKAKAIQFIPGTRLTAEDILEYGAEIVIIATGSHWAGDGMNAYTGLPIPGVDSASPWVLTPEQILRDGKPVPGERVTVYDCEGYVTGLGLAERLRAAGHEVEYVVPHGDVWARNMTLERGDIKRQLAEAGIVVRAGTVVNSADEGTLSVHNLADGGFDTVECDALVPVTLRAADDSLYRELDAMRDRLSEEGISDLYRIGDCVAPRLLEDAIFDGHRLAREIDSADPAVPLLHVSG